MHNAMRNTIVKVNWKCIAGGGGLTYQLGVEGWEQWGPPSRIFKCKQRQCFVSIFCLFFARNRTAIKFDYFPVKT